MTEADTAAWGPDAVARFLRQRGPDLVTRFERRWQAAEGGRPLLAEALPAWLAWLADHLQGEEPATTPSPPPGADPARLFHELVVLRGCVRDAWLDEGHGCEGLVHGEEALDDLTMRVTRLCTRPSTGPEAGEADVRRRLEAELAALLTEERHLGFAAVFLGLDGVLELAAARGGVPADALSRGEGLAGAVLSARRPVLRRARGRGQLLTDPAHPPDLQVVHAAPILGQDGAIGLALVGSREVDALSEGTRTRVVALTQRLPTVVTPHLLREAAERRDAQLRAVAEAALACTEATDEATALHAITSSLRRALGVDAVQVVLRWGAGRRVASASGVDTDAEHLEVPPSVVDAVLASGVPRAVHDVPLRPSGAAPAPDGSVLAVPVGHRAPLGVLCVLSRRRRLFREDERIFAASLADLLSASLERLAAAAEERRITEALELGDACLLLDPDWRITFVNRNQEALSQKPQSQTLGRVFWEVWPQTRELRYWDLYHHVMEQREPVYFEEYFPPLDLWTDVSAYPTRDGGIAVFFRDKTAQKEAAQALRESEARLRHILDRAPAAILILGADGRYRFVNRYFTDVFGLREEEVIGRTVAETHGSAGPERIAEVTRLHERVLVADSPLVDEEVHPDAAGRERTWHALRFPLFDEAGRAYAVCAILADITERKAHELHLAETATFRERFIGVLGHDLRNPVSAVSMSAQLLLRRGRLTHEDERVVEQIVQSTRRMATLIGEVVDLARGRLAGGIPVYPDAFRLDELTADVVGELRAAHPGRDVRVTVEGDLAGCWDRSRLAQVITNLVSNALKHGHEHTPVEVALRDAGDEICLEVRNEGEPIPPDQLSLIFAPFRGVTGRGRGGLGLGLYIVQELVHAHGGRVSVSSSALEGTRFLVSLPRRPPKR